MNLSLSMTAVTWSLYYIIMKRLPLSMSNTDDPSPDSLVLVHVLFRHGNRTANGPEELYPKDPYLNETYFPIGLGQLTKVGKSKEYSIGTALRRRYDKFLGDVYYPEIVEGLSTDYNRTKASLQLVLAGLFPPTDEEVWNPALRWQPIPYNYAPKLRDKVLIGVYCPNYKKLSREYVQSDKHQAEVAIHKEVFDYISLHTGLNITTYHDVYELYFGLSTEEEWGFKLPAWTENVWPDIIVNLTVKYYFIETATTDLIRMASGYFLEKLLTETNLKINDAARTRKIHLYSAHENNVADFLITLGVFEPPHVPPYGSYVILEVHKISGGHGIKIFYENYTSDKPRLLKMPGCEEICELNKFVSLIEEYLPSEDLCGF